MAHLGRTLFPYAAVVTLLAAVAWSISFSTLPPADFTFDNNTEVQSIDPARVTGTPEGRIISALFEGLYRPDPKTLRPLPGMATHHDLSADGRVYTFHIRRNARWSDGTPLTARDFVWSWQRMLHPETASQYASLLCECVVGASKYHDPSLLVVGDAVEVELSDRPVPDEPFPRGTVLQGKLLAIDKPPKPAIPATASPDEADQLLDEWQRQWTYTVEVAGRRRLFCKDPAQDAQRFEKCMQVLFDFERVGIKLPLDKQTRRPNEYALQITLLSPTPYFVYLADFFPLFPVERACVEKFGYPNWTKAANIVTNGPYRLEFRRLRDRIRMRKNPDYWDSEHVRVGVIDALAVESNATALNMYLKNQMDWCSSAPAALLPQLQKRPDYAATPSLTIAYFALNVTHKPLDNVLVRRALNRAIDKRALCENLLKAGQQPARSFVPPGLEGYTAALCGEFDVKEAQRLLAEAGYPGGKGFDRIEILHTTGGDQETMVQAIGNNWEKNLGLRVTYRTLEWGSYLSTLDKLGFDVARSGWTGDYPDPNTFLGLLVKGGEQNETGWGNARYDELIHASARETNPQRRMQLFHEAEKILMDQLPVIPIYAAVSINMVQPYVRGFYPNAQDAHPLRDITIDAPARARFFQRTRGSR